MSDGAAPRRSWPGGADPEVVRAAQAALEAAGTPVTCGGDLGGLTTYRVGGAAALLVAAAGPGDLAAVAAAREASGMPVLVVGRGSNLLVADAGFGGIAVTLDPDVYGQVSVEGTRLRAGAAVALPVVARQSVEAGLTGLEWAVGVPGSVGGGVRMNAGGHGSDMAHHVGSCVVVDLEDGAGIARVLTLGDLDYGYRRSSIEAHQVVVEAVFVLAEGDPVDGRQVIREIVRWRREHQPGGQNAGSVFTNPPGEPPANSAGWLIEQAGCKGLRWGTATVSAKHANFIQADSGGSADDVWALINQVRRAVEARHRVRLHTEVRLIGFDQPSTSSKG